MSTATCAWQRRPVLYQHSYRSAECTDADASTAQWVLYIRQYDTSAFTFTVVLAPGNNTKETATLLQLELSDEHLEQHIAELGIEVTVNDFVGLLKTTLEERNNIDVCVDANAADRASVVLTYCFSETISRRGRFELQRSASDVPLSLVALLIDLHSTANVAVLNDQEKAQQRAEQAQALALASQQASLTMPTSIRILGESTTDDGAEPPPPTSAIAPQVLKRRRLPTGTSRRTGSRGAKLAKSSQSQ